MISFPDGDAIDAALSRRYPGVEPTHYATLVKWMLGGPDPLDGISVYRRADHRHFISYGMSELYAKDSDNADDSGWGFEFTFRVAHTAAVGGPPMWAVNVLQNLARYVFTSGNSFAPGHRLDLNGPISLSQPDTRIRAIAFADDPELGVVDTPHGRLRFLQVVGLTLDEHAAIQIPPAVLRQLTHVLRPVTGTYRLATVPELTIQIIKWQIRCPQSWLASAWRRPSCRVSSRQRRFRGSLAGFSRELPRD